MRAQEDGAGIDDLMSQAVGVPGLNVQVLRDNLLPFITEEDQAGFFGENAARLLGLRESVGVSNGPVAGCP